MLLAGACVEAMREFAVERRQRREALVQKALGKLRFGLVQEMFANWRDFTQQATAEKAAADAYEYERRRVDVQSEVLSLRRQLALTRKELAQVSASTAWRYELAVVRNELRHAIKVIAMHADGIFAHADSVGAEANDGSGTIAAQRAEWLASGGGADAAYADAAGLPGVAIRADAWAETEGEDDVAALPSGPPPLSDTDIDSALRFSDNDRYHSTQSKQVGNNRANSAQQQQQQHYTYPMRPAAMVSMPRDARSESTSSAVQHRHHQPVFGVVGVARAEEPPANYSTPRPPSAPAGRAGGRHGPTLASRMQSPRVRGLATAQDIQAHVAQRLCREQDRLGLERTQSDQPPWVPRMA